MLRQLSRLLHIGNRAAPGWDQGGWRCAQRGLATAKDAHNVLDEVAHQRLQVLKRQLEATGELQVKHEDTALLRVSRFIWRTVQLGLLAAGTAATYYTYRYEAKELSDIVKRTRAESGDQPLQRAWCDTMDRYLSARRQIERQVKEFTDPSTDKLLPDLPPGARGNVVTLVLDLDELLVHKEWDRQRGWVILKRAGLKEFLMEMAPYFEVWRGAG
jgi:import inner membrane translocase subunit TIM50